MGIMGAVDDGCDCVVMTDGGYEITDFESKRSDEISMSAIMVMIPSSQFIENKICLVWGLHVSHTIYLCCSCRIFRQVSLVMGTWEHMFLPDARITILSLIFVFTAVSSYNESVTSTGN
jgi:hypothetical protein